MLAWLPAKLVIRGGNCSNYKGSREGKLKKYYGCHVTNAMLCRYING